MDAKQIQVWVLQYLQESGNSLAATAFCSDTGLTDQAAVGEQTHAIRRVPCAPCILACNWSPAAPGVHPVWCGVLERFAICRAILCHSMPVPFIPCAGRAFTPDTRQRRDIHHRAGDFPILTPPAYHNYLAGAAVCTSPPVCVCARVSLCFCAPAPACCVAFSRPCWVTAAGDGCRSRP